MADSLGLKRACRSARGTGRIEGPAYCRPPVPCQTSTVVLVTLAAGARLLLAAAAPGIAGAGRGVVAPAAMALGSRGAGLLRCELVGVTRSVRCTAPLCGDLALAVGVHRGESAPRARLPLAVVPAPLALIAVALVLVALIGVCHFHLR